MFQLYKARKNLKQKNAYAPSISSVQWTSEFTAMDAT